MCEFGTTSVNSSLLIPAAQKISAKNTRILQRYWQLGRPAGRKNITLVASRPITMSVWRA
jgi:hypothetical protein